MDQYLIGPKCLSTRHDLLRLVASANTQLRLILRSIIYGSFQDLLVGHSCHHISLNCATLYYMSLDVEIICSLLFRFQPTLQWRWSERSNTFEIFVTFARNPIFQDCAKPPYSASPKTFLLSKPNILSGLCRWGAKVWPSAQDTSLPRLVKKTLQECETALTSQY